MCCAGYYLEAQGYKVRVTELTGFEHTQKNEMILAERHQRANPRARAEFEKLVKETGVCRLELPFTWWHALAWPG